MTSTPVIDAAYRLEDRFERDGRLYLTGWDALVRLPLMQRRLDEKAGLMTAGFVSGYPGSPLGGLDSLFRSQRGKLAEHDVHFEPGLNEDLAVTSIWGTQYLNNGPVSSRYDGVFGLWYGKGPGLERSTDAMRTANYQGVSRFGGVLALAGDDHNARSTVTAQQSETLFVHMHMPVLNPATVQEYLDYGLAGWALSRFACTWVGMICLNDTADSAATVFADPALPAMVVPNDVAVPPTFGTPRPDGVAGAANLEVEIRTLRIPAAQAFARTNSLDRVILPAERPGPTHRGLGVVASGKAYLDVLDALTRLGLSLERAAGLGLSIYKVAMPYPLEPENALQFVDGLDEVLIVEPKYPLIEDQVNRLLRRLPSERRPEIVGKTDETGRALVPEAGALNPVVVAEVLLRRLQHLTGDANLAESLRPRDRLGVVSVRASEDTTTGHVGRASDLAGPQLVRAAGFCSGCPHSTSTKVPDGSLAIGGTGCHGMAISLAMPGRETHMFTHMGGEGALWIGMFPFADTSHVFQNMGDGTYSHSGYLAIRAAIAANVNMTFKVLLNGYISMTGGQAIPGGLQAQQVAAQVLAEGARRVTVVTDDPARYATTSTFPAGVRVHHRDALLSVQEELRAIRGVTVLIYDQPCAAELRRDRKRGRAQEPRKRAFINEAVCEGCGDCNVQSNCISVEPLETDLGRKRTINQSSCNKDFSCLDGYCPSFVSLYGATPRRRGVAASDACGIPAELLVGIPEPTVAHCVKTCNILVGGIGGGGVLTLGGLLGMAAHLEGKAATVLNESGLAQKNGAVQSHIRIAAEPGAVLSARIAERSADLVIGIDILVVAGAGPVATMDRCRTFAVVNQEVSPTVAFARDGTQDLNPSGMVKVLQRATGDRACFVGAQGLATALMGDSIYANLILLGYAAQLGKLPVGISALERAIEINGVSVDSNKEALRWGRLVAHDIGAVLSRLNCVETSDETLDSIDALIGRRRQLLTKYQSPGYADRYEAAVRRIIAAEQAQTPGRSELSWAVAHNLAKLMAFKDEYEVARLYTDPAFTRRLQDEFEGNYSIKVNLAPQLFNHRDRRTGRAKKWEIPFTLARPAFRVLARGRHLRGTRLDIFGRTDHRRAERDRIISYEALLGEIVERLSPGNHSIAVQLASLPELIRGYDTVKDASAEVATAKEAVLLSEFRQ